MAKIGAMRLSKFETMAITIYTLTGCSLRIGHNIQFANSEWM